MNSSQPTNSRYGFFVLAVCFFTLFMLWGLLMNSFTIFFKPIIGDLGTDRGALGFTLTIRSLGMILCAPLAGRLIDRFGARPVMATGSLVLGLGVMLASRATAIWQLHVIFLFIGAGLMSATTIPCSLVISNWFVSRRATALAATFLGTSVGGAVMTPVGAWILREYNWRTAFMICGGIVVAVVVPAILLIIRDRPSDIGLKPYMGPASQADEEIESWGVTAQNALSMRVFWQIAAMMFIVALVTSAIHTHTAPYLTDIGHLPRRVAYAWSLVMFVMMFGKVAFGPIADRWGARKAMAGAFIMYTLSILALSSAKPFPLALTFSVLYGLACGAPLTLYPLLLSKNLGLKHYGAIYGNLTILGAIGGGIGPLIAGEVFDRLHTYLPVFYVAMVLTILGAICAFTIKPAPRRI